MAEAFGYSTQGQTLIDAPIDVPAQDIVRSPAFKEASAYYAKRARVSVEFTREAANTGSVSLFFVTIGESGEEYPNMPSFALSVDLNDANLADQPGPPTLVRADGTFDMSAYYAVKLLSVMNSGLSGITGLSAKLTYKL